MFYKCSKCKREITKKEYDYSMKNFNIALCRKHQKKNNSTSQSKGLSKRESDYKKSMIKGRIAETLVEELFLTLGYGVFRYGMENTVPGVTKLLLGVDSEVAHNIRKMPDLVVQDKQRKVYFIEIKFRKSGKFDKFDKSFKNLFEKYPYKNCYFVVVSKKHIKCISYSELMEGKDVSPTSKNYLGSRKEFDLDKKVIIDFCNFAVKFFKEV